MLVLDENVSENEIWRLREAGLNVRTIGQDIAVKSVSDENIIPALLKLKKPTSSRAIATSGNLAFDIKRTQSFFWIFQNTKAKLRVLSASSCAIRVLIHQPGD
jgi:hypothetical protein